MDDIDLKGFEANFTYSQEEEEWVPETISEHNDKVHDELYVTVADTFIDFEDHTEGVAFYINPLKIVLDWIGTNDNLKKAPWDLINMAI